MDTTDNDPDYGFDYTDEEDVPDQLCRKDSVVKVGSVLIPLFFGVVVLLSLVGNVLVLAILAYYENLKSLTNVFILNLALSDLLFTAGLPFWACYYIWGWTLGDVACRSVLFVFYAGFYSSVVFLMLMTVQRYMAVVHPLSDWERGRGYALIPVGAWLVSVAAASPAPILGTAMPDPADASRHYCEYNSAGANLALTYAQNAFFALAFAVMGFCYKRILQTIFKTRTKKRHRTIKLIFCIVVVFFLGWAPYNLLIFLQTLHYFSAGYFTLCSVSHHLDYAEYVCKLLAFSHCCLNPVFYVFVGVKFRNYLKEILQKIFRRPAGTPTPQTRTAIAQSLGTLY